MKNGLTFSPIKGSADNEIGVPDGYTWEALAAWGDSLTPDAPDFDSNDLDAAAQRQQVGCNCDFVACLDIIRHSGIVGVNHEYTNPDLMFPNYSADHTTQRQVDYETAAHGVSMFLASRRAPPFRALPLQRLQSAHPRGDADHDVGSGGR